MYDTNGGLKINPKAQVVSVTGAVIQGLFAAGMTAHMVIGFYYPNGGAGIGGSLAFCRIAGPSAAAEPVAN